MTNGKVIINLQVEPAVKSEIQNGCKKVGASMTAVLTEGGLKEIRNRLRMKKILDEQTNIGHKNL